MPLGAAAAAVHAARAGRRGGAPAVPKDLEPQRKRAPPREVPPPREVLLPPAPAELGDGDAKRLAGTTPPNANGADAARLLELFMAGMP